MSIEKATSFHPATIQEWRKWLESHHITHDSVWLIMNKKKSGNRSFGWSEAVDEALCFGWIDSVARTIDDETYKQYFSKRKATSTWSRVNKVKIERLIAEGLMLDAGLKTIEIAKQNGSWEILDDVEDGILPDDLIQKLDEYPDAKEYVLGLSLSVRKMLLSWIALAKRPETREKRINEIAENAAQRQKPKFMR